MPGRLHKTGARLPIQSLRIGRGCFSPKTSNHSLYPIKPCADPAILGETSTATSYQMVRLVFRPYTQIRPLICTLKPLRASTRVSSGFALFRHSSPSFGSQHMRSYSAPQDGQPLHGPHFHSAQESNDSQTRAHARLLGPCFKTGRQVWPRESRTSAPAHPARRAPPHHPLQGLAPPPQSVARSRPPCTLKNTSRSTSPAAL